MASFRPYQQQAFDAIVNELQNNNKCIVKMFCGSGKSLIMHNIVKHFDLQLSVFVFPSLSLVDQFYTDYLKKSSSILKISSDAESTTEIDVIAKFINNKKITKKIICITYQSFNLLLNNLQGNKIDVCCFDEAHHAVGNTYQKLIFNDDDTISKQIFFTATPKNANGIVMYDRNDLSKSMCGNLVYDYSYLQGVNEGFLNPFEIRVDLFTENTNKSIYESIARAILTTGNSRVLTFHSSVNSESDSSIINFVDEKAFKLAFNHVVKTEFPTKKGFYKKFCMIGLDAKTIMVNRREILKKFKKGGNDDTEHNITVLCSCETIGEGVDTNDANMCVFVDPKSSVVKIIQNIGRIVRKQYGVEKPNSTILIPCWVGKSKYEECNGVKEECDKVIREDMNSDGNFSGIMNVLSALQQEQPDVYDMCLNYPDTYSYNEIEANFTKQGYKIDGCEGFLDEILERVIGREIIDDDINIISQKEKVCIEVYTDSVEEPVIKHNEGCDDVVRLLKTDEYLYKEIVKENGEKKGHKTDKIEAIDNKKRVHVKFNANDDIKVLWNIKDWGCDLQSGFKSCILNCEVIDMWNINFQSLKTFIDINQKMPSTKGEKRISKWLGHQNANYNNRTQGMKNDQRYDVWTCFIEQYKEYFISNEEVWNTNFEDLKEFVDTNRKTPRILSKNKDEKTLACWLANQKTNYKNRTQIMKNDELYIEWTGFLKQYNEYFLSNDEVWNTNFKSLKEFMDSNKRRPSESSKNNDEISLTSWLASQITTYKNRTNGMKNDERYDVWTNFLEQYNEYFLSNDEVWDSNFDKLKEFMDTNKKIPQILSKNKEEKILLSWLRTQNNNYKNRTNGMKNDERYSVWTNFLEQYSEYFISNDEVWDASFEKLKEFIDTNKKTPSIGSKNKEEKILCSWLSDQTYTYKNRTKGMKNDERRDIWTNFLERYKEYFIPISDVWNTNFEQLKDFIDTNKKKPSESSKNNDEISLTSWLASQITTYKNRTFGMKSDERYSIWTNFIEQYKEYFIPNDEVWDTSFQELKTFIDTNQKTPSRSSTNKKEKVLGSWLYNQNRNYMNQTQGMKCDERYCVWTNFIDQYNEYFISNDGVWNTNFQELKTFIDTNQRTPSSSSKNNEEKVLGKWLSTQVQNYRNRTFGMNCDERYYVWTNFLDQYNEYFVSNDGVWNTNLQELKTFIDTNQKPPSHGSTNKKEKVLGSWLNTQIQNYKNRTKGMNCDERYSVWTNFLEQYKEYFISNDEVWNTNFQLLRTFIDTNKKKPSRSSKNDEEKVLGKWLSHQNINYKNRTQWMKCDKRYRYSVWTNFLEKYNEYFNTSTKIKSMKLKKTIQITETIEQRKQRTKSQMEILHQRYKTLSSTNLNKEFSDNKNLWNEYHEMSEQNEESFPKESIPRNVIIDELDKQKTKRTRTVVDMGCGRAQISKHFTDKNDTRFQFINYDHVSSGENVISCDISSTPLENDSVEIVILSLAMWGSNCKSYIAEANRILESNGLLYIIEATKRWSEKDENHNLIQGEEGGKLKKLLIENHFQVSESKIEKFSLFICNKRQII